MTTPRERSTLSFLPRWSIVCAMMRKDLAAYTRDRFYVLVTILALVVYVVLYWVLPSTVNESIEVGVHHSDLDSAFEQVTSSGTEGIEFTEFASEEELLSAIGANGEDGSLAIAISFPPDFVTQIAGGKDTTVKLYVDQDVPDEVRRAISGFVREFSLAIAGDTLPVTLPSEEKIILGVDRAGEQVSLREKLRPMIAFLVLMMETLALGSLVAVELHSRTLGALLVTPLRVLDFLTAKALFGTLLALSQAVFILLLVNGFASGAAPIFVALVLGALLVTGFGLISGSTGRDFLGMMLFGLLFMIPLAVPAVAVLFPGSTSLWVKIIPSYGLVEIIFRASSYQAGWRELMPFMAMLLGWCLAIFGVGLYILTRRVRTL